MTDSGAMAKAKKIIYQTAKEELEKMRDSARGQVFDKVSNQSNQDNQMSPVVEAMQQRSSEDTLSDEVEKKKHNAQIVKRLRELEEEIMNMRARRRQQVEAWQESQQQLMGSVSVKAQQESAAPIMPDSGKPKRGSAFARGGKGKKGGGQPKSLETRKSKH